MSLIGTRSLKLNESGQAVIEYMLVLVITVILVGTFAYQFSSAFKKYANNYFGDYVMCLLESGELPGQVGECKDLFQPFDFKAGTTASGGQSGSGGIGSGTGGSGSGSSGSGSGKNGKSTSGKSASADSSSNSGSSSKSAGPAGELGTNAGGSDSGSSSGRKRSTTVKNDSGSDAAGAGGNKAGRPGLKPIASSSNDSSSSSSDPRGRRKVLDRGFGFAGQEEQQKREEERPATKAVAKDEEGDGRPKKVAMSANRKPAEAAVDAEAGFTFGKFLKFILIAGIIIAILMLFGGQLLAISKGGEK